MIDPSWIPYFAPVGHMKNRVIPTICDVNHNDPDPERLMKMTHTICGGHLMPKDQETHSGGEMGNDMIFLVTPYGEVCVFVILFYIYSSSEHSYIFCYVAM